MKDDKPKIPLSVVLIARNESRNLPRVLGSVKWAAEILVYDSGSGDDTVAIAEKLGARVIRGEWRGFGPTKQAAVRAAAHDWILSLDCDEEVTPELHRELAEKWAGLDVRTAYAVPRLSRYLNRWIRHGGWYPDYQVRIFHRGHSHWNAAEIHEKVQAERYQNLASRLNHYVFRDIAHQVETNNRYSGLQAAQMSAAGKKFSWFHFFTKPYVKFIECYLWKLGILDGWPGYVIARNAAYSVYLKWVKLRELEERHE